MYVYTYGCIHIYIYKNAYIWICAHTHIYIYIHTDIADCTNSDNPLYIYIHTRTRIPKNLHTFMNIHIYTDMYIYICIYIYTRIYIFTHTLPLSSHLTPQNPNLRGSPCADITDSEDLPPASAVTWTDDVTVRDNIALLVDFTLFMFAGGELFSPTPSVTRLADECCGTRRVGTHNTRHKSACKPVDPGWLAATHGVYCNVLQHTATQCDALQHE